MAFDLPSSSSRHLPRKHLEDRMGIPRVEKRRDLRIKTRFETLYSEDRHEGVGVLADISYSGVLIEGASLLPEVGSKVRLYVFLQPVSPYELIGQVVRTMPDGFAIEYNEPTPEIRALVDDLAAIVAVPPHSE
jgi:hypothetical protein